jgi:hypothetical protein
VELFTSEGCSSCPPVDAWLQKLDESQPVPDAQLIVLSEHVDYWDHDGWKDPYSSHSLTERQQAYVAPLHGKEIYTPQMIVDGASEVTGNDSAQITAIFRKAAEAPKLPVSVSSVSVDSSNPPVLHARIEADDAAGTKSGDVYVAIALAHAESQVLHGENGGKHLIHVAVLQDLAKIGKVDKGKSFSREFQQKLKPGTDASNLRIIAFVQEPGPGRVLGSAMKAAPFQ